eukprot:s1678_g2.t1
MAGQNALGGGSNMGSLNLPQEAFKVAVKPLDGETDDGSISEWESSSSLDVADDEGNAESSTFEELSSESDAEDNHASILIAKVGHGDDEILTKGQKRRLLAATKEIHQEALVHQTGTKKKIAVPQPLAPKRWKIIELFTWSCMEEAMDYLRREDPDFLVIAWPCGPWSSLQNLNQKTEAQRRVLMQKRMHARRTLLRFTRRAALHQRRRRKAVLGENLFGSLAWKTPGTDEAFDGCAEAIGDQCQFGLQHPTSGMALRKRTRLRGQEEVVQFLRKTCPGDHEHAPIEGGFKDADGKWRSLSERAGGYPPALCKTMIHGAEAYLTAQEQQGVYVEDPGDEDALSEGDMMDGEEQIEQKAQLDDALMEDEGEQEDLDQDQRHPIPQEAVRVARRWHCDVCARRRAPKHPQAAAPVKTRQSASVAKKFYRHWVGQYCPPEKITLDQGGEFEKTFNLYMEQLAVPTDVTAAHAGWQLAAGERHGGILRNMVDALVNEHSIEGCQDMKEALAAATSAKNGTMTKDGYTPHRRVFGFEVKWPSLNDEEVKLSFRLVPGAQVSATRKVSATAKEAIGEGLQQPPPLALEDAPPAAPRPEGIPALEDRPEENANEWVSRYELDLLRHLTDLPLAAARIHRAPRKRLARPPKLVSRGRLSVLLGKDTKDAFVVEETPKEVDAHPRRRVSLPWKGIRMYYKEKPKGKRDKELKDILLAEVMLLKMKASGKELDPKFFNAEEKEKSRQADAAEWKQWMENGVIRRLRPEEAHRVPRDAVFKSPMRMAPAEGLPAVADWPEICPYELLQVLKFWKSMASYVRSIKTPEVEKKNPAGPLTPKEVTCYRQLVMRRRWPAQQTMPHLLYWTCSLAQRVNQATYADFVEAVKLHELMVAEAGAGRARLFYPKIKGEPYVVSYFDASLGKERDGKSQLGGIHFLTNKEVRNGPQLAAPLEYHTGRSTRVVRSSMAAESNSMSVAIDRHLHLRILLDLMWKGPNEIGPDWREKLAIGGALVTDAKSLYDHMWSTSQIPTERQTMLDLLVCKDMLQKKAYELCWVPAHRQYADALTKKKRGELWEAFCKAHRISLKEAAEEKAVEEHRQRLRQGQRQRRKQRFTEQSSATDQHYFFGM